MTVPAVMPTCATRLRDLVLANLAILFGRDRDGSRARLIATGAGRETPAPADRPHDPLVAGAAAALWNALRPVGGDWGCLHEVAAYSSDAMLAQDIRNSIWRAENPDHDRFGRHRMIAFDSRGDAAFLTPAGGVVRIVTTDRSDDGLVVRLVSSDGHSEKIVSSRGDPLDLAHRTAFCARIAGHLAKTTGAPADPITLATTPIADPEARLLALLASLMEQGLVLATPRRFHHYAHGKRAERSVVLDLSGGDGIRLTITGLIVGDDLWVRPQLVANHALLGDLVVGDATGLQSIWDQRRRGSVMAEFATGRAAVLPLPPTGNARAARLIALCARAIEIDPDLATEDGAGVAPLLQEHLPRLLSNHDALVRASIGAQGGGSDMAAIDADLDAALDKVRLSVERALDARAADDLKSARDAVATDLRFLAMRHPVDISAGETTA